MSQHLVNGVSGSSTALESIETTFHQDLNGDGVIGLPPPPPPPPPTVIEAVGSTSLDQVGSNLFPVHCADRVPNCNYTGAPVVVGQFGSWTPIGAEQTSSGYDVAWKMAGADQYSVWSTDSSGNYICNISSTACREPAARWNRSRPPFTRTSTATA